MATTTGVVWMEGACPYCSSETTKVYHGGSCPRVKSVEYHLDGSVKKVEFVGSQDRGSDERRRLL